MSNINTIHVRTRHGWSKHSAHFWEIVDGLLYIQQNHYVYEIDAGSVGTTPKPTYSHTSTLACYKEWEEVQ